MPQRFTRVVRPDQEGRYQSRALPPGDYLAIAVPALESGDEWDPAFRKRVEPSENVSASGRGRRSRSTCNCCNERCRNEREPVRLKPDTTYGIICLTMRGSIRLSRWRRGDPLNGSQAEAGHYVQGTAY